MRWEAAAVSSIGGSKNGIGREKSIQLQKREWGSDGKYDKKEARVECIRHVLYQFDYHGKEQAKTMLNPDPNIVMRYHRSIIHLD